MITASRAMRDADCSHGVVSHIVNAPQSHHTGLKGGGQPGVA
jgi:hypothetical protein